MDQIFDTSLTTGSTNNSTSGQRRRNRRTKNQAPFNWFQTVVPDTPTPLISMMLEPTRPSLIPNQLETEPISSSDPVSPLSCNDPHSTTIHKEQITADGPNPSQQVTIRALVQGNAIKTERVG